MLSELAAGRCNFFLTHISAHHNLKQTQATLMVCPLPSTTTSPFTKQMLELPRCALSY